MQNFIKILDSQTDGAYSEIFKTADNSLSFRFKINGSPNSKIKVFLKEKDIELNALLIKTLCSDFNSSYLTLECLSSHVDDVWSNVDLKITKNCLVSYNYV